MQFSESHILFYGRQAVQAAQALPGCFVSDKHQQQLQVTSSFVCENRVLTQVFPMSGKGAPANTYTKSGIICLSDAAFLAPKKCDIAPLVGNAHYDEFSLTLLLQQLASLGVKEADISSVLPANSPFAAGLNALQGDFCVASPDESGKCLMLAVSAFNAQSLFYTPCPDFADTYIICDNLAMLLQIVQPRVCHTALSFWLAGRPDPNRSLYANIHQVPQAGAVLFRPDKPPLCTRFWDIRTSSAEMSVSRPVEDYQAQLSAILESSVLNCLPVHKGEHVPSVFTQLSGGMDSTTVSATACLLAQQHQLNVHSVSHTYKHTQACDESDNIAAMIARCGFTQSHFIELDKYTQTSFSELYPCHLSSPGTVLSPKYHEEAALLVQQGATTLLTGNGGDEMFWGHSLVYFDRLMAGDLSVISEVISSAKALNLPVYSALKSALLGPLKRQLIGKLKGQGIEQLLAGFAYPAWLTSSGRALIESAQKPANPFADDKHNLARFARYEGLFQTATFNSMRSYQAVFQQYGLQVKHPLMNKELAQYSFDVPQQLHISGAFPKLLLRQTMHNRLPEQVCWNKSKTVFDEHFANLIKRNENEIRGLLKHEALADLGLIDNSQVLRSFDRVMSSQTPSLQVDLLYAILVQSWFQRYCLASV